MPTDSSAVRLEIPCANPDCHYMTTGEFAAGSELNERDTAAIRQFLATHAFTLRSWYPVTDATTEPGVKG